MIGRLVGFKHRLLMRVFPAVVVAATLGIAPAAGAAAATPDWQPGPPTYGDMTVANVAITMSDGVVLVGDVIYPTDVKTGLRAPGRFPVLLTQNPYVCQTTAGNTQGFGTANSGTSYFVHHGYIFASICVRGTGRSGGDFSLFSPREQRDGVELVGWAAHRLDGSNGVVGLTGCSYLGITQLFTAGALERGSPVKAILPSCSGSETFREASSSGGMPTETINYLNSLSVLMDARAGVTGTAVAADALSGGPTAYDREYNRIRTPGNWAERIVDNGIPALLWSGWNDIFVQTSEELYAYFQNAYFHRPTFAPMAPGQRATGRYQIIVGPWGHGQGIDQSIELRWFDTWLKGKNTGMADSETPMHLYQLGSGTWTNTSDYPMVRTDQPYYLSTGGGLTPAKPTAAGSDSIAYTQPAAPGGSLTYTTAPFAGGLTLAGPVSATLHASSSNKNLNLIAELDDVAPNGNATKLSQGSQVGSVRAVNQSRSWFDSRGIDIRPYKYLAEDDYLVPGKSYELLLDVSPRLVQVAPGHALRLELITQMPAGRCGALLGTDPCYPTAPQQQSLPGTYQVQHSPAALSAINLPVLPFGCFPATGGSGPEPANLGDDGPGRTAKSPCPNGRGEQG